MAAAPLALTMGEPAGIGGEIGVMAWLARDSQRVPPFFALDDPRRLDVLAARLGLGLRLQTIAGPEEAAAVFPSALPIMPVALAAPVEPGRPDPANAPAVLAAIERAVALCRAGRASAVVTNPIHKEVLYRAGFRHPGHTEYLAALTGAERPVMLLAGAGLRVVPVSIHVSLRRAIETLNRTEIVAVAALTARSLKSDFAIAEPRLAVAGLNPHAGEGGSMGMEDAEIVAPAVAELRRLGIDARGPLPPDTMFHAAAREGYDVAVCMYHDQALIPLKTLDFDGGVNVTLGLPVVRTSPDHGTAFDIAGTGRANPGSLIAALKLAADIAGCRTRGAHA